MANILKSSASSQHGLLKDTSDESTKQPGSKIVRYELDLENPPPLTEKQKAELEALAARPESDIDFSDIPPLTEDFWKNAVRNPFMRPVKQQATVRLDADVLDWLKSCGKGYQTRLNAILRKEMLADLKRRA